MPDPQLFSTEVINTATWKDDTHNPVSSNAAALLLISLARRYLPTEGISFSTGPSSSQHMICSLSVTGDTKAEAFVDRVTSNYLRRAILTEDEKNYIRQKVSPDVTLNTVLDRVVLTEMINGSEVTTDWYLPLREVFAFVLKALDDRSPEAWPVPEGSIAQDERKARFAELARVIKALAANPKLCSTGIRHALAQALDGYFGKRLPLNPTDLLLQSLRKFMDNIFQEQLSIRLPVDKDPTGADRALFYNQFNEYFLPWLRHQQMPSKLWKVIRQAGGSRGAEQFILNEFSAIGVIPDKKVLELITNYCLKSSLKTMPCDFIPFLASAQGWIARHAGFLRIKLNHRELTAKQHRVKQVLHWLATGLDMDRFYFVERLFDCYDHYQRIANLFVASDFSSGIEALSYSEASAWMRTLFSDPECFRALLEAEDISPFITHLGILEKACDQWRLQHYSDFIKNFFSDWFAHVNHRHKALLFGKLAELFLREQADAEPEQAIKPVIFVDDKVLGEWLSHLNTDQSVDIHPYEINRILLHAICYLPETWTPVFFDTLNIILRFIRNDFNSAELSINDETLKRSSYPDPLLNQLDQLTERYRYYSRGEPIIVINEKQPVLSPSLLQGVESCLVIEYLSLTPDLSPWLMNTLLVPRFGFEVNAPNEKMFTPLCSAIARNHLVLFNFLLNRGANPGLVLNNGYSPLLVCILYAERLLKPLLEAIDRFNTPKEKVVCFQQMDKERLHTNNPLQCALETGSFNATRELIRHIRHFSSKDRAVILKATNYFDENALLVAVKSELAKFKLIFRLFSGLRDRAAIRDILLSRDSDSHNVLFYMVNKYPAFLPVFLKKLSDYNDPYLVTALLKQRIYHDNKRRNIFLQVVREGKATELSMLLEFMNQSLDLNSQLELMVEVDETGQNILMAADGNSTYHADSIWNCFADWLRTQAHPQILCALMKQTDKNGNNQLRLRARYCDSTGRTERLFTMIELYKQLDDPATQSEMLRTVSMRGDNLLMFYLKECPNYTHLIIELIHALPNLADKLAILNQLDYYGKTPWQHDQRNGGRFAIRSMSGLMQTMPSEQLRIMQEPRAIPLVPPGVLVSIKPYLKKALLLLTADYLQHSFLTRKKNIHDKAVKALTSQLKKNQLLFGDLVIQLEQLHLNQPDKVLAPIISTLYAYVFEIMKCFSIRYDGRTRLMEAILDPSSMFKKQLAIIAHLPFYENRAQIIRETNQQGKNILYFGLLGPRENLALLIDWINHLENPQDRLALFKDRREPVFLRAAFDNPQAIPLLLTAIKGMETQDQLEILGNYSPKGNILFEISIRHPDYLELVLDALDCLDNPEVKAGLLKKTNEYNESLLMINPMLLTSIILKHVSRLPLGEQEVILRQTNVFSENALEISQRYAENPAGDLIAKAMKKLDRALASNASSFFHKRVRLAPENPVLSKTLRFD